MGWFRDHDDETPQTPEGRTRCPECGALEISGGPCRAPKAVRAEFARTGTPAGWQEED